MSSDSASRDIFKAKALLAAAGYPSRFITQLITQQFLELPQYAQVVVQSAASIGVTIQLRVESSPAYYGKATFGSSDWLDATWPTSTRPPAAISS